MPIRPFRVCHWVRCCQIDILKMRQPLIDMEKASLEARPGDPFLMQPIKEGGVFRPGIGGTTTCVVTDRWGNVVSATPSANVHRPTVDGGTTGVTYGNRLRSLNTTPGHPNCIEPGKRPAHYTHADIGAERWQADFGD